MLIKKGKRKLNDLGKPDVLVHKKLHGKQYYPTEKPVSLIRELIENSSDIGDTVLDCFAGSGSTGIAALESGRKAIFVDHTHASIECIKNRLEKVNV